MMRHESTSHAARAGLVGEGELRVRVLGERERLWPAVLHRIAQAMERADAGIAAPGEGEPRSAAHADQLIVDEIGRHADQMQIPPTLAHDFLSGGERDEMGEPLERHAGTVAHVRCNRLLQRQQLHRAYSTTVCDCSRRYWGR